MKTLTKKLLTVATVLLIIGMMIFCVACNPYAGNYKEVSAENREQVVAKYTEKLEAFETKSMEKFTITYKLSMEMEYDGAKYSTDIELTINVDGDKTKTVVKLSSPVEGKKTENEAIIWTNAKTQEIFYKVTSDGKTETGKYNAENSEESLGSIVKYGTQAMEQYSNLLDTLLEGLAEEDAKLYTDGDKLKIVAEEDGVKLEAYVIFNSNGTFRSKIEMSQKSESGTTSAYMEIVPTSKSVTMPNYK